MLSRHGERMSDFLDHLLARNIPGLKGDSRAADQKPAWVRPRLRSLFESTSAGLLAPDLHSSELAVLPDDGAAPQPQSGFRAGQKTLQRKHGSAVAEGPVVGTVDDSIDHGVNDSAEKNALWETITASSHRTQRVVEHVVPVPLVAADSTTNAAAIRATAGRIRASNGNLDRKASTIQRPETSIRAPAQPAPPNDHQQQTNQLKGFANEPSVVPKLLPALDVVTPVSGDAALRIRLQGVATLSRTGTRVPASIKDTANRTAPPRQTIQVSIGRVEIRAHIAAPTGTPSRNDKVVPQVLGLDDYLRQQAGGGRE